MTPRESTVSSVPGRAEDRTAPQRTTTTPERTRARQTPMSRPAPRTACRGAGLRQTSSGFPGSVIRARCRCRPRPLRAASASADRNRARDATSKRTDTHAKAAAPRRLGFATPVSIQSPTRTTSVPRMRVAEPSSTLRRTPAPSTRSTFATTVARAGAGSGTVANRPRTAAVAAAASRPALTSFRRRLARARAAARHSSMNTRFTRGSSRSGGASSRTPPMRSRRVERVVELGVGQPIVAPGVVSSDHTASRPRAP